MKLESTLMTRTLLTELALMPMTDGAALLDGAVLMDGARILWAGAAADAPALATPPRPAATAPMPDWPEVEAARP